MIRFDGVGYDYASRTPWEHTALDDVSVEIEPGESVLVVGPNGSGKSTFAWLCAGLLVPTRGTATLEGRPLHTVRRDIGLAFQHARLALFRPTVAEDVAFGTDLVDPEVDRLLDRVGLDPAAVRDRRVDVLSGGEQRRVLLAALLARRPRVLILDEPLAGLDPEGRASIVGVVEDLEHSMGLTTIVVTHDLTETRVLGDRVIALDRGRVVRDSDGEGSRR